MKRLLAALAVFLVSVPAMAQTDRQAEYQRDFQRTVAKIRAICQGNQACNEAMADVETERFARKYAPAPAYAPQLSESAPAPERTKTCIVIPGQPGYKSGNFTYPATSESVTCN